MGVLEVLVEAVDPVVEVARFALGGSGLGLGLIVELADRCVLVVQLPGQIPDGPLKLRDLVRGGGMKLEQFLVLLLALLC